MRHYQQMLDLLALVISEFQIFIIIIRLFGEAYTCIR